MMLQLNDEYLWYYNVESLLLLLLSLSLMSSMLLMLYVVVEKVVESMHTNIKLGAHALLNINHSYHVGLRAYALHVTPCFPNNVNNTNNQSIQRKTECHTTFKT